MKNREELEKILHKKNFKSFWHCFEFLITASYTPLEAFSISLKHYGEDRIFENVAFIRPNKSLSVIYNVMDGTDRMRQRPQIIVGIVTDNNIHLTPIYKVYNKWYHEQKIDIQSDIESSCDVIEIYGLTPFIRAYLVELMMKYYGIEIPSVREDVEDVQDRIVTADEPYEGDILPSRRDLNLERLDDLIKKMREDNDNMRNLFPTNQPPNRA